MPILWLAPNEFSDRWNREEILKKIDHGLVDWKYINIKWTFPIVLVHEVTDSSPEMPTLDAYKIEDTDQISLHYPLRNAGNYHCNDSSNS